MVVQYLGNSLMSHRKGQEGADRAVQYLMDKVAVEWWTTARSESPYSEFAECLSPHVPMPSNCDVLAVTVPLE